MDFLQQYENYKLIIDNRLKEFIKLIHNNSMVAKAMSYSLNVGGKRIRPILILEFCRLCDGLVEQALDIACAVEMIHTYSLIHDDLPCMDDSDLRRGKPSCHVKFGQAIALLAGDGLLTYAFNIISKAKIESDIKIEVIELLSESIGHEGMILGQEMDISHVGCNNYYDLLKTNNLKTGKLIKASSIIGCIIAEAPKEKVEAVGRYGSSVGLAFQIQDDIMDVVGDEFSIGKPVCNDKKNNKITFVDLVGVDNCKKKIESISCEAKKVILEVFDKNVDFIIALTDFLINRQN